MVKAKSPKAKKPAKGTTYDANEVAAATAGHYYMRLGGKGGNLYLTGARQKWAKEPGFVYLPAFRVAGNPQDVLAVLTAHGYSDADVRAHIAAGYSKVNSGAAGQNVAFDAELEAAKNRPKVAKAATVASTLRPISYYVERLEDAKAASPKKRTASPKKGKAGTKGKKGKKGAKAKSPKKATGTKGKRAKQALADRYEKLAEGKVLDVSKYTKKDKEAKTINAPTAGGRSKKIQVPGLALVSEKRTNLKSALSDMGYAEGDVEQWLALWDEAVASKGAAKAASPAKAPSPAAAPPVVMPPAPQLPAPAVPRVASPRALAAPAAPRVPSVSVGSPRGSPRL